MKITDFLKKENIRTGLLCSSKKRVFELICNIVSSQIEEQENSCFEAICHRERMGNTGLNNGIAIPHAKLSVGDKPVAVFLQLDTPIKYDSADHRDVDLIFAILIPETCCPSCSPLLPYLAECFSDKNLCKQLRLAKSPDEVWSIFLAHDHAEVVEDQQESEQTTDY
ncbi:PTS IIA-like nitrogen regulatory protein PtsN [Gallibacterium melopsittaci]|uniref:PTS IIA-like nitrogen regulatory protein PtsN n=1 Tax=Gallibacterium melopsittaci TaxID=516063 RepID=A0ABV6HVE0_9PAST